MEAEVEVLKVFVFVLFFKGHRFAYSMRAHFCFPSCIGHKLGGNYRRRRAKWVLPIHTFSLPAIARRTCKYLGTDLKKTSYWCLIEFHVNGGEASWFRFQFFSRDVHQNLALEMILVLLFFGFEIILP